MYAWAELNNDIQKLKEKNKFAVESIGRTALDKDIYLIKTGETAEKNALIISGHHSLETITSKFVMEYLLNANPEKFKFFNLFAVPLLNVDGADFVCGRVDIPDFQALREKWQANYNGVDLNHNYDAGFYLAQTEVEKEGITGANCTKYGGSAPFCEPETQAIERLCEKYSFDMAIAFHTQGEEIYFGYDGIFPKYTHEYLDKFVEVSGYNASVPTGTASHAGFKDWFILKYNKPAYTIEAGLGVNPISFGEYENICEKCGGILDAIND